MQIPVKWFKVLNPPPDPSVANAVYFVFNDEDQIGDIYVTNSDGVPFNVGNAAFVQAVMASALALKLTAAQNLADLGDAPTALTNLGLSANARSLVTAENYAAMLALLELQNVDNTPDADKPVSAAQQAAIDLAIANLIASAPGALDTLNELAAAMGDDPDFAATVTNALAGKQPLSANLTTFAGIAPSANVQSLLAAANYAAFKTLLSLVKGDVGLGNVDNTSDANKPVSTAQQAALDLKAPLASPSLTGTPTAPTAAATTSTTQIATTAFVIGEKNSVVGAAPSGLDTLAEIAAAIDNDPAFHERLDDKIDGLAGVKRYVALLSQGATSDPTATVLENTLGGTVVWTRDQAGIYSGTLSNAFTQDKTVLVTGRGQAPQWAFGLVRMSWFNASVVKIVTYDIDVIEPAQDIADEVLANTAVMILVYP